MRLDALREVVRGGGAEQRAAAAASVAGEDAVRLYPALVAMHLVEPSLRVRTAIEEALRRRPPADLAERPLPAGTLSDRERVALVGSLAHERGFLEVMLASPRGRDLLLEVPLGEVPLDDHLVSLCLVTDARVVQDALALPLNVAGRSPTLIAAFPHMAPDVREAILGVLVWASVQAERTVSAQEVARARSAVALWVTGLIEAAKAPDAGTLELPPLEAFLGAGGKVAMGPVTLETQPLGSETIGELTPLGRLLLLALVPDSPQRRALVRLREAARSSFAELRGLAWRLLLEGGHATPEEALAAVSDGREETPGVVVEVLRALPAGLSPALGGRVCALLSHPLASVRRAAVQVLARNPALAAIAAAQLDPRAPDAPLDVLAALPDALRAGALTTWLERARPPEGLVRALELLERPAPPTWSGWPALLQHEAPRVRQAARAALLRSPAAEGEAVLALLGDSAGEDPLTWARALERFAKGGRHADLARLLLDDLAQDAVADVATRALARRGDALAWAVLWTFVAGSRADRRPRRFGSREARARALDALLLLARPTQAPTDLSLVRQAAPDLEPLLSLAPHLAEPRLALLLIADRDPWQVRLGLRLAQERGATDEVRSAVARRLRRAMDDMSTTPGRRRFDAGLARFVRGFFARSWYEPAQVRGGLVLLPALLDAGVRLGKLPLWADDLRPLLGHEQLEVRAAAARAYGGLPGALPLREVVRRVGPEAAREALRVGHPLQVEAVVLEKLARARAGDAPLGDVGAWIAARPRAAFVGPVGRFLDDPATRAGAVEALVALHAAPEARLAVEEVVREHVERAAASREDDLLVMAAGLVRRLRLWSLVPALLRGAAWARQAARDEAVDALREAQAAGFLPGADDLTPLLRHALGELRVLALSLLRARGAGAGAPLDRAGGAGAPLDRAGGAGGLWAAVRAAGPTPGRSLPTDFSKAWLGACEDAWEEAMALPVELLLGHPSGEVARRALKLLNRRERELSTLALLEKVEDPELRQPVLTTFSTWATRFLDVPGPMSDAARAERLEAARRELRAGLEALAAGARARAAPLVLDALASPVTFTRAAALFAIGRLGLVERTPDVVKALGANDPVVARCAAWTAGALLAAPGAREAEGAEELDAALERLARAREPELRATARRALVRRLAPDAAPALESALTDASPEVRLLALDAALDRPEVLAGLALEARLGDPDPRVRERVLVALSRRVRAGGPPPAAHALRGALADDQPEVRLAALELVRGAPALAQALAPELGDALADPSVHVSGAAIDAVAAAAGAKATPPVEAEPPAADEAEEEPGALPAPSPEGDLPTSYALPDEDLADSDAGYGYGYGEGPDPDAPPAGDGPDPDAPPPADGVKHG